MFRQGDAARTVVGPSPTNAAGAGQSEDRPGAHTVWMSGDDARNLELQDALIRDADSSENLVCVLCELGRTVDHRRGLVEQHGIQDELPRMPIGIGYLSHQPVGAT